MVGSHIPSLTVGFSPNPVPYNALHYTEKGRLTDSATGEPLGGVTLYGCIDTFCPVGGNFFPEALVTDAAGYFTWHTITGVIHWLYLLSAPAPKVLYGLQQVSTLLLSKAYPVTQPSVSGATLVRTARTGSAMSVTGKTYGIYAPVQVQWRDAAGAWHVSATTAPRSSERFTARVPVRRGRVTYRVYLPPGPAAPVPGRGGWAAASGRPFVVVGG